MVFPLLGPWVELYLCLALVQAVQLVAVEVLAAVLVAVLAVVLLYQTSWTP